MRRLSFSDSLVEELKEEKKSLQSSVTDFNVIIILTLISLLVVAASFCRRWTTKPSSSQSFQATKEFQSFRVSFRPQQLRVWRSDTSCQTSTDTTKSSTKLQPELKLVLQQIIVDPWSSLTHGLVDKKKFTLCVNTHSSLTAADTRKLSVT